MASDQIDSLLERYLSLLDQYTQLRTELSTLQTGMFQDLARANFSAERGMRYGQDYYDERMQASRRVAIEQSEGEAAKCSILYHDAAVQLANASVKEKKEDNNRDVESNKEEQGARVEVDSIAPSSNDGAGPSPTEVPESEPPAVVKSQSKRDPLRWFGLLSPPALRAAQAGSVRLVEDVVPKLVSVAAEMAAVEIEVGRARKRRAKALKQARSQAEKDNDKAADERVGEAVGAT